MSGLELPGFILSVIPLVLMGLQGVQGVNNNSSANILFKYQHVLRSFMRDLDMEHAQFRSTIEKILGGLVDEVELASLLENRNAALWKDKELERRLKQRIGPEAYRTYMATVERVASALAELWETVGLKQTKKDKWHKEVRKRIKRCIEDSKHTALLEEIRKCNQALSRLTDDTIVLEPLRLNRRAKAAEASKWEFIRELATSLHQALESGWLCDCPQPHLAHLRLERRSEPGDEDAKFGVLFSSASDPRGWQETEINITTAPEEIVLDPALKTESPTTRVKFSDDSEVSTDIDAVPNLSSSSLNDDQRETRIKNLCHKLKQCTNPGYIGFLDDENHKHYIHVFPPAMIGDDVSLADILSRNEGNGQRFGGFELGLRDKYELAVTLATSVLQLHATPWLDEHWSSKDVYLVRKRSENSPSTYIQKAFDSHKVREVRAMSDPPIPLTPVTSRPSVRNETIFALGVSLIELSLGRPLASFENEADLMPNGERSYITDWLTANRLLREKIAVNEGDRYSKTVNRCINCIFDPLEPSLENAPFRQAFYDNAVVPLKEILIDFVK